MRYVICLLVLWLAAQPCLAARPSEGDSQPRVIKVKRVIPEAPPEDKDQYVPWLMKWVGRNRMTVGGLRRIKGYLQENQEKAQEFFNEENARRRPNRRKLDYYERMEKWFAELEKIADDLQEILVWKTNNRLQNKDPEMRATVRKWDKVQKDLCRKFAQVRSRRPQK